MSDLVRTQVQLTQEQHRAARILAAERGVSLSVIVREAMREYLERQKYEK